MSASIFTKSTAKKAIALTLAASFALTTALPVTSAEAGHRKHKRHNGGELLAAGIVGLALGAIIVDHSNKRKRRHTYSHTYVQPQPDYQPYYDSNYRNYDGYDNGYDDYRVRRPLPGSSGNNGTYTNELPRVIRYEDEYRASYEPWTPEWQSWCRNKYRSFKPSNGTFRGYDGKNHFCVVK